MSFCKCGRAAVIGLVCACTTMLSWSHDAPHTEEKVPSPWQVIRVAPAHTGTSSTSSVVAVGGKLVWFDVRKPSG